MFTREEGLPLGSLVLVPLEARAPSHGGLVVVIGKAGVRSYCPNIIYFRFFSRLLKISHYSIIPYSITDAACGFKLRGCMCIGWHWLAC